MLYENIKLPTRLNSKLQLLQPYPHEKLRRLFENIAANPHLKPIDLSVGEPKHPTPEFIQEILNAGLSGFANYPPMAGSHSLRQAIADWVMRRYQINNINSETQVIATLGSREALFSLAQTVLDNVRDDALVLCPNPFYQIYEGSALLAGAQPSSLIPHLTTISSFTGHQYLITSGVKYSWYSPAPQAIPVCSHIT